MKLRTPLDQLQELITNTCIVMEQMISYYIPLLTSDLFTSTETILRMVVVDATVSGFSLLPAFSSTIDA
jgi:hypothetical protein